MKPIVFFSHSSKDKLLLNRLKESLLDKTNHTVDIFLSSDGESIPFGKNWVYTIEEALQNTSLMFVFLSPNSVQSNWIYFESGYSYSKKIEVIPIGILGVDLNQVYPPLNLLQGFNINAYNSLNNLIKTVNDKFGFKFPLNYTNEEYLSLFITTDLSYYSMEDVVLNNVDYIKVSLPSKIKTSDEEINSEFDQRATIIQYFENNKIPYRAINSELESHGFQIILDRQSKDVLGNSHIILFDPLLFGKNTMHLKNILNLLYDKQVEKYYAYFFFKHEFEFLDQDFKISSRLLLPDIQLTTDIPKAFKFENIYFVFDNYNEQFHGKTTHNPNKILRIIYSISEIESINISKLISLLFELRIIYKK